MPLKTKKITYEFSKAEVEEIIIAHLKANGVDMGKTWSVHFQTSDVSDDRGGFPQYEFTAASVSIES